MTETIEPDARSARMRTLALVLGGIEAIGFLWFVGLGFGTSDPLGRAIWQGMAMLAAVPFVALTVPGLVLAYTRRRIVLALALVLAAVPVAMVLWWNA